MKNYRAVFFALTTLLMSTMVKAETFNLSLSVGGPPEFFPVSAKGYLLADTAGDGFEFLQPNAIGQLLGVTTSTEGALWAAEYVVVFANLATSEFAGVGRGFDVAQRAFDSTKLHPDWNSGDQLLLVWFPLGTSRAGDPVSIFRSDDSQGSGTIGFFTPEQGATDAIVATNLSPTFLTLPDIDPPEIVLLDSNPLVVALGTAFKDPGATVTDNFDAQRTIPGVGNVDTNVEGTYTLTYNASDAAGNDAEEVTRTVEVRDLTPPVITLLGNNPLEVAAGLEFTDPGARVTDNVDEEVVIEGEGDVDTSVEGTYTLSYNAVDAAGNDAEEVNRTVIVKLDTPSIVSPNTVIAHINADFTYQITASGLPTAYSATPLPPGLTFDAETGVISGTPTKKGKFVITVGATNSKGTGTATLTLLVAVGDVAYAEKYAQTLKKVDGANEILPAGSYSCRGKAPIFSPLVLTKETPVEVTVGKLLYEAVLGNDIKFIPGKSKAVKIKLPTGALLSIAFSKTAITWAVTAKTGNEVKKGEVLDLETSPAADDLFQDEKYSITSDMEVVVEFALTIDGKSTLATIPIKGKAAFTVRKVGSGDFAEEFGLNSVSISGKSATTPWQVREEE